MTSVSEQPREAVAEVVAALTYGQRLAGRRAAEAAALAPDAETRARQEGIAARERENLALLEARLGEVGGGEREDCFAPFFDAFFERTTPSDWIEAQTFFYVGDALVAEFAEALMRQLDPVSSEVVRRALCDRDDQDAFALDQLKAALADDPAETERVASFARRVAGEALTQTRRALDQSPALSEVLGDEEAQKRILLDLLDRHRRRLDRLGIEPVDEE
jgi:hypothetical protein